MEIFEAFKLIHILAVISAVGANLTYAFWLGRAGRDRDRLVFVIESIGRLDRRVANPSYIVAAIAGACVVITGPFHFESAWLLTAIAIYVLVAVLGISVYAPAMRAQLALARTAPESDAYAAAARRSRTLGLLVTLMVLAIVALMVIKPVLWAA